MHLLDKFVGQYVLNLLPNPSIPAHRHLFDGVRLIDIIGFTAYIGFAAQAKFARFGSAGASALHTPPLLVLI